jgi:hypothetical protein
MICLFVSDSKTNVKDFLISVSLNQWLDKAMNPDLFRQREISNIEPTPKIDKRRNATFSSCMQ